MSDSLFQSIKNTTEPLAARMRPRNLDEYSGQDHIVGKGRLLRRAIAADQLTSVIFYGPPGIGKSTVVKELGEFLSKKYHKQINLLDLRLYEYNPVDLKGIPYKDETSTFTTWLMPKILDFDRAWPQRLPTPDITVKMDEKTLYIATGSGMKCGQFCVSFKLKDNKILIGCRWTIYLIDYIILK